LGRRAIDIGQEMHAETARQWIAQRIGHEARPEIGTADADADDVGNVARFELCDQCRHTLADIERRGVGLACDDGVRVLSAKRGMQRRTSFGDIDFLAIEQAAERTGQVGVLTLRQQRVPRGRVV
jgi:hypothetical protein